MRKRQDEFEQIALPFTRDLLRFARRLRGQTGGEDDLVQETLLHAWRGFPQFRKDSNIRAWLYRILLNTHYSQTRRPLFRPGPLPVTADHTQEELEVRDAVARLPEEQRTIILLAVVEGFTSREIAGLLSIPVGTVMSRLSRARQTMREILAMEQKTR